MTQCYGQAGGTMKIGEFAKACGSSVRMIRFYEKFNLINPLRNANG